MYFSDRITLRDVTVTTDANAMPVEVYTDTEIWSDKRLPSQKEFYTASQAGIELTQVFMVRTEDYNGQTEILYNGASYKVSRTFYANGDMTGLVCSDKAV